MSNTENTAVEPKTSDELLQEAIDAAIKPVAEKFDLEIKVGAVSKKKSLVITTCERLETPDERISSPMMKSFLEADENFNFSEDGIELGETVSILLPEKSRSQKKVLVDCMLVTAKPNGRKKRLVVQRLDGIGSNLDYTTMEYLAWKEGVSTDDLAALTEGTAEMYDTGEIISFSKK